MKVIAEDTISLLYGDSFVNSITGKRNFALGTSENYTTPFTKFTGESDSLTPRMMFNIPKDTTAGAKFTISAVVKIENIVRNTSYSSDSEIYMVIDSKTTQRAIGIFTFTGADPVSEETKIVHTITISEKQLNDATLSVGFKCDGISSGSFQWKEFKIEQGSEATKWTQAPEDIENEFDDINAKFVSVKTSIESCNTEIALKASKVTVDTINDNLEMYKTQTTSMIQDVNGWQFKWDKILNANGADIENYTDYITFDSGDIILGESDNDLKVKISNAMIQFKGTSTEEDTPDSDATAWITGQTFNINTGEIHDKLLVGKLQISPRANGNLSISLYNR